MWAEQKVMGRVRGELKYSLDSTGPMFAFGVKLFKNLY